MTQETLKEAAKRLFPNEMEEYDIFLIGARWQQERSYTEDEVLEIIRQYALEEHLITSAKPDMWFKQFKKK